MDNPVHNALRHRGESLVEYPDASLWTTMGGSDGVAALIEDLYRRIEQDELLRVAFPHFNSGNAAPFFVQWFGGSRAYSDDLAGGLLRRHQHRYISPKAAAAWLHCMREALVARGLDAEQITRPLARIAKAMIHSLETEPNELCKSCGAVQEAAQVQFETLLSSAAKGRTETVRAALEQDRSLASRRGIHNQTLAWVATYRNRPKILELTLKAGGDCNSPACDPMHATMACDDVQMGTGVAVTPLAMAKKWHPALVAPLVEHGAIDDVFTAAWLGDLPALRGHVDRNPELVNAIDPNELHRVTVLLDYGASLDDRGRYGITALHYAVRGGKLPLIKFLLERGAHANALDGDGLTPLLHLSKTRSKADPIPVMELLAASGANIDARDESQGTLLMYFARRGHAEPMQWLLAHGADRNARNKSGKTAAEVGHAHAAIVRMLAR